VAITGSGHTFVVDDGVANAVYKKIDASSIEKRRTGNGFKRLDLNFKCLNWRTRKNNNTKRVSAKKIACKIIMLVI